MTADIPNRIAEAMETITKTRNIEKITVRDLTEICGISRQTFYYYFRDMSDVFRLVNERGIRRALKKCAGAKSVYESIEIYILDFLDFHDRIKKGLSGPHATEHVDFVNTSARRYVPELLKWYPAAGSLSLEDREFLIEFFSSGISHVIIWHGGSKSLNVPRISRQIADLLSSQLGAPGNHPSE